MKLIKTFQAPVSAATYKDRLDAWENTITSKVPGLNRRLADDEAQFLLQLIFKRLGRSVPNIEVNRKRKQSEYVTSTQTISVPYSSLTALTVARAAARSISTDDTFIQSYSEILAQVIRDTAQNILLSARAVGLCS